MAVDMQVGEDYEGLDAKDYKITAVDMQVGEDYEGLDAKDGKLTAVDMQGRRRLRGPRREGWQAYGGGHARSAKTTRASTRRTAGITSPWRRMASLRRWTCRSAKTTRASTQRMASLRRWTCRSAKTTRASTRRTAGITSPWRRMAR